MKGKKHDDNIYLGGGRMENFKEYVKKKNRALVVYFVD